MRKIAGNQRILLLAVVHCACFVISYAVAILLRFDFLVPDWMSATFCRTVGWLVVGKLLAYYLSGQFRAWWGHVAFSDLAPVVLASTGATAAFLVVNELRWFAGFVPRSVLLLDLLITIALVVALRSLWRLFIETILPWIRRRPYRAAILIGASSREKIFATQLHRHSDLPFRILGFLDHKTHGPGEYIDGARVLGSLRQLKKIAKAQQVTDCLVIAGSLKGSELRRVRHKCQQAGLRLHIIPPLDLLVRDHNELPVNALNLDSLLQRAPIELDETLVTETIAGTTVLVTGAGGSIGSELCRQILKFSPAKLVVVERSEPSLYQIERELRQLAGQCRIAACLADISDVARMQSIFEMHSPQTVFHAAAHKHVPLLESQVSEAVKNNIFGTMMLADLANKFEVQRFVLVSTDKAVKPASIMGVTKHLAERYVMSLDEESLTKFTAVRFGNVLGSAGSVVPLFYEQIRAGGPITITDPRMQRYFMTIKEASRLVLQASAYGNGGDIFVLDMGEPIKIIDLAQNMIQQSGLPPHAIDIVSVGIRPGEKYYEELYFDDEIRLPTPHPKLFCARHRPASCQVLSEQLQELRNYVDFDERRLVDELKKLVPEYTPDGSADDQPAAEPALANS